MATRPYVGKWARRGKQSPRMFIWGYAPVVWSRSTPVTRVDMCAGRLPSTETGEFSRIRTQCKGAGKGSIHPKHTLRVP